MRMGIYPRISQVRGYPGISSGYGIQILGYLPSWSLGSDGPGTGAADVAEPAVPVDSRLLENRTSTHTLDGADIDIVMDALD